MELSCLEAAVDDRSAVWWSGLVAGSSLLVHLVLELIFRLF